MLCIGVNGPLGNVDCNPYHLLEDQEDNEYCKVVDGGNLCQLVCRKVASLDCILVF